MKVYSGDYAQEIAFPLSGIGTGGMSIFGICRLVDWELDGSANIGRKAFSEYTCTNLLNSEVIIVNHPDKCPVGLIKTM